MTNIWAISDTHFGHEKIIRLAERNFSTVMEMNNLMINRWNSKIKPDDVVYHLGDFSNKIDLKEADKIFSRLNGRKYLLPGNHDSEEIIKGLGWKGILPLIHIVKVNKINIVMSHYPLLEWPMYYRGAIHIHGHQHNKDKYNNSKRWFEGKGDCIDVGVDANNYEPTLLNDFSKFYKIEGKIEND